MKQILLLVFVASMLLLSACDGTSPKSKIANPLAGHVDALNKAKELEKSLQDSLDKQQKAIDQMSQ